MPVTLKIFFEEKHFATFEYSLERNTRVPTPPENIEFEDLLLNKAIWKPEIESVKYLIHDARWIANCKKKTFEIYKTEDLKKMGQENEGWREDSKVSISTLGLIFFLNMWSLTKDKDEKRANVLKSQALKIITAIKENDSFNHTFHFEFL